MPTSPFTRASPDIAFAPRQQHCVTPRRAPPYASYPIVSSHVRSTPPAALQLLWATGAAGNPSSPTFCRPKLSPPFHLLADRPLEPPVTVSNVLHRRSLHFRPLVSVSLVPLCCLSCVFFGWIGVLGAGNLGRFRGSLRWGGAGLWVEIVILVLIAGVIFGGRGGGLGILGFSWFCLC